MYGTAYFLDGHVESIYSCEITDLGFLQRVEFYTLNGKYKLDYEYIPIYKDIRISKPNWFEYIDGQWILSSNGVKYIELYVKEKNK